NYVVAQDRLMEKAEELAATIAANGPLAVRKIKEAVRRTSGRPLEEAFKIENECARERGSRSPGQALLTAGRHGDHPGPPPARRADRRGAPD
ncbi:MAG: enoyl-CoA hydratase/isomerase family protein, partial [Streptosporangiaceae bacterium]